MALWVIALITAHCKCLKTSVNKMLSTLAKLWRVFSLIRILSFGRLWKLVFNVISPLGGCSREGEGSDPRSLLRSDQEEETDSSFERKKIRFRLGRGRRYFPRLQPALQREAPHPGFDLLFKRNVNTPEAKFYILLSLNAEIDLSKLIIWKV